MFSLRGLERYRPQFQESVQHLSEIACFTLLRASCFFWGKSSFIENIAWGFCFASTSTIFFVARSHLIPNHTFFEGVIPNFCSAFAFSKAASIITQNILNLDKIDDSHETFIMVCFTIYYIFEWIKPFFSQIKVDLQVHIRC